MSEVIEREVLMSPAGYRGKAGVEANKPMGVTAFRIAEELKPAGLRNRREYAPGIAHQERDPHAGGDRAMGVKHLPVPSR
ncbi:MAG: hypothetical protein AB7T59_14315 [Hyphomonadaceae bacterium]